MNNIILHIPHSSLKLPSKFYDRIVVDKSVVKEFNLAISDLYTYEIFGAKNKFKKVVAKYSRIYCDVEKFTDDDKETMSKFGMGYVYTHTHKNVKFEEYDDCYKQIVKEMYYQKHHDKLDKVAKKKTQKKPTILLDCHSFSKEIIMFEENKENLPDICIGFDKLYYSEKLVNYIKTYFVKLGYNVAFNYPYESTMIPNYLFSHTMSDFYSVMIEINRNIYLNDRYKKNKNFHTIQKQVQGLLRELRLMIL